MALLSDYTAGTVTIAADGTAVTGTGTGWLAAGFAEGDLLASNGYFGLVGSVESNTALTLAQPWRGGELTGAPYRLRYQGDGSRISAQARQLIEMLGGSGNIEALGKLEGVANSLAYFTGPGQLGVTALTEFARSLLDDIDASTVLSSLGFSAFAKALLGEESASTLLNTIGLDRVDNTHDSEKPVSAAQQAAFDLQQEDLDLKQDIYTRGILSGFRNRIINGDFKIHQRAISQTGSGYGSDDRWSNNHGGSSKTHSIVNFSLGQTDVPGEPESFSRTVVASVAGADNYVQKYQSIESVRTLAGKVATVTFWAKADATRKMAIEMVQNFGAGGSPSSQISGIGSTIFNLTTSWQKYTAVVSIPSLSGKVLGSSDDGWLRLAFWFDAGTSFAARHPGMVQQSGTFDLAHVSLVEGDASLEFDPFSTRDIGSEFALCQRYYYKSEMIYFGLNSMQAGAYRYNFQFPVRMRSVASISLFAGIGWTYFIASSDVSWGCEWLLGTPGDNRINIQYIADAEI